MKRTTLLKTTIYSLLAAALAVTMPVLSAAGPSAEEEKIEKLKKEFLDLKFGMFLHYNMATYTNEEWVVGYPDPSTFNPGGRIDTDQWADVAKAAGMKYGILTAKHDAKAQKEFQMKQIAELLEKYPDCFYFWNDAYDPGLGTAEELLEMERRINPNVLASSNWWSWGKKGKPFLDIAIKELGHFPETNTAPGETCFTITGRKWFWKEGTSRFDSPEGILGKLRTANSRNSNFLLNVPPNRQGKIAEGAVKSLEEVGKQLRKTK